MAQDLVLLVEDDPADARIVMEAFNRLTNISRTIVHVSDGEEAMAFLRRRGKYAHAEYPALVLLDLNLPKKDGREVLAEMKQDSELLHIPVVVLTTSRAPEDVRQSYRLHANAYVQKPFDLREAQAVVDQLARFWLKTAILPVAS
jgi:two-component system response regulator